MIAGPSHGASFPLVLCTGHGPLTVDNATLFGADAGKKAPAEKSSHDAPCTFTGHIAAAATPDLHVFERVVFVAYADAPALTAEPDVERRWRPAAGDGSSLSILDPNETAV